MITAPILHGPAAPDLLRDEVLADVFEATAARTPCTLALIFGERQMTYGELDALANAAAHRLIAVGVRPGDRVGLWLPRGMELLALQLAIAKTGAAWLPFNADTPPSALPSAWKTPAPLRSWLQSSKAISSLHTAALHARCTRSKCCWRRCPRARRCAAARARCPATRRM